MQNKSKLNAILLIIIIVLVAMSAYLLFFSPAKERMYIETGKAEKSSSMQTKSDTDIITQHMKTIELTLIDQGKTETLEGGQIFTVTLGNPGDGGYRFDAPKFDTAVLQFKSQRHIQPAPDALDGDFGRDVFEFEAIHAGQSKIDITASRPWEKGNGTSMFSSTVIVK